MLWCSLMIWASIWPRTIASFVLEGSQTSYAQFRQWHGGQNDTLAFEFGSTHRDSMLLYSDNNQEREYLQIKLVNGHVMLRYVVLLFVLLN